MRFDEVLLCGLIAAVLASTYMGWSVRHALYHFRRATELSTEHVIKLENEIMSLRRRVTELEK